MLQSDDYIYKCSTAEDIPNDHLRSLVHPEIARALGRPLSEMFPALTRAFPSAVIAIESSWPSPILAFKQIRAKWYAFLVSERPDANLFYDLRNRNYSLQGPEYEQDHVMLRQNWRELYRWFESFVITEDSVKPMTWWNTPFSYSARLSLEEYSEGSGAKKQQVRDLRKRIGSERLMCWLLTEAGDALFIDEEKCDQAVYHLCGAALEDIVVLDNPDIMLDRYLAYYISGGAPQEFDFRHTSWCQV